MFCLYLKMGFPKIDKLKFLNPLDFGYNDSSRVMMASESHQNRQNVAPTVASQSMDPDDQIMVLTANEHSLKPQMLGARFWRETNLLLWIDCCNLLGPFGKEIHIENKHFWEFYANLSVCTSGDTPQKGDSVEGEALQNELINNLHPGSPRLLEK